MTMPKFPNRQWVPLTDKVHSLKDQHLAPPSISTEIIVMVGTIIEALNYKLEAALVSAVGGTGIYDAATVCSCSTNDDITRNWGDPATLFTLSECWKLV